MIRLFAPIISAIIASLIFSKARKEARKAEAAMDINDFVIRQPKINLIIYIIITVLFFSAYVLVLGYDDDTRARWLINLLAMSPFLALGPFLIVLWRRWKITIEGNRITVSSYFGKEKTFTFDDITKVKRGTGNGNIEYIRAYSEKKKVFTVTGVCPGFEVLAQRLEGEGILN